MHLLLTAVALLCGPQDPPLRLATFVVDATPPVGAPMAYDITKRVANPLSCRGIVLSGADKPIVLCAVDWIGIGNGGQDAWRAALAEAAGTTPERVAVHALHQHDAPGCDLSAEKLLAEVGLAGVMQDPKFVRETIARAARAVREAKFEPITHIGTGKARVEKVASNRRIQCIVAVAPYPRQAVARAATPRETVLDTVRRRGPI